MNIAHAFRDTARRVCVPFLSLFALLAVGLPLAPLAQPGQEGSGESADFGTPATEGSGSDPEPVVQEGSGEGSGVISTAVLQEGSGEIAEGPTSAEHAAASARGIANGFVTRVVSKIPIVPDERVETLRSAETPNEAVAELLGIELVELSQAEPISARLATLETELTANTAAQVAGDLAESDAFANAQVRGEEYRELAPLGNEPLLRRTRMLAAFLTYSRAEEAAELSRRELSFTREKIRYLERRNASVEAAASAQEAGEGDAVQLATTIEEGQAALEASSQQTDEVEVRAAELSERARQEREQARTEFELQLASEWALIGPALERIALQRRSGEERLSEQNAAAEQLAITQVELAAAVAAMRELPEDVRPIRADDLLAELIDRRMDARDRLVEARNERVERAAVVEDAEAAFTAARAERDADLLEGIPGELRGRWRELNAELADLAEQELGLEQLRYATANTQWRLTETETNSYARTIDRLIPLLSQERRRRLLSPTGANLLEASRNFSERLSGSVANWVTRLSRAQSLGFRGVIGSLGGVTKPLLLLFLLLFVRRSLPGWRDTLTSQVIEFRNHERFRRFAREVLKAGELLHVVLPQVIGLLAIAALRLWMPFRSPELEFVLAIAFWVLGFRLLSKATVVLIIPRRDRDSIEIVVDGEGERIGVDILDLESRRAQLINRTVRICLTYYVSGRVALATVKALFGPGFLFYYAGWAFQLGLIALLYLISWYWRKEIVEAFCARSEASSEPSRFTTWIRERVNKPYIVLVTAFLAAYLIGIWIVRYGTEWMAGRGPGQRIANFFFQRRIARANTSANTAVGEKLPLPVAYQRIYRDVPVSDEPYRVARPPSETGVEVSLESWRKNSVRGTVAIVGDPGSGKTSWLAGLPALLGEFDEVLASLEPPRRLTTEAEMVAWLAPVVLQRGPTVAEATSADASAGEAPDAAVTDDTERVERAANCEPPRLPTTSKELVEALQMGPRRVIAVDCCERLFLRTVGGFEAIVAFFDLVTLTNHNVFWVLAFDRYSWHYLHRVRDRRGYFRDVFTLRPLSDAELRTALERRNEVVGLYPTFDRLTASGDDPQFYEVVRSSAGYYRLLAEASGGNMRVAFHLWLKSVTRNQDGSLHVALFERTPESPLKKLDDDLLFALNSIVQHGELTTEELAVTVNTDPRVCEVYLNHLRELGILEQTKSGAVRLHVQFYVQTLAKLRDENLLDLTLRAEA
ncbi:MAG: hypothetical protein ACI81R_000196 [Bradymonadia bacterium]